MLSSDCDSLCSATMYKPEFGHPFYHLNLALLPEEIFNLLAQPEDSQICRYDEYGFELVVVVVVDSAEDVPNGSKNQKLNSNQTENDDDVCCQNEQKYKQIKTRWIEYLKAEYDKLAQSSCFDLSKFDADIERRPVLDELIIEGITNELRPFFWLRLSRSLRLKVDSRWTFTQLTDLSSNIPSLADHQVAQVLPNNACFVSPNSVCSQRLKHILQIIKWYQKTNLSSDCGTESSLNLSVIGAYLLLVCSEEDSFWLLLKIDLDLNTTDCIAIVNQIMYKCCPMVADLLHKHNIEFDLIASNWFSSIFAGFLPDARLLFHLWDLYFYSGPILLVQLTIGMLIIESKVLESQIDSAEFFNTLSDLPRRSFNSREKIVHAWNTGKNIVENLNINKMSVMFYGGCGNDDIGSGNCEDTLGDQSSKDSGNNVGNKPKTANNNNEKSSSGDEIKQKNVKQTSLIVNLNQSIVAIAHHFRGYDIEASYRLEPDYDNVDKVDQREDQSNRLRLYRRRAKALIDFKRNDTDELGFVQNDIITIINEKDEHCWIGELNGEIGWFPAKFVEILDERDQDYCIAGDDRVVPFINDLVRGRLCSALKSIFHYDMKRHLFLNVHPWTIVEELANFTANSGLKSIHSRLILTKTFRLDDYRRVLTPNELLYRSIALINHSHQSAPLDVKFRSLICLGLNQYVLHDWFELICTSQPDIIARSYHSSSFLRSPVWKMIKAQLKLLVQFSFHLNPNAEIEAHHNSNHNNNNNGGGINNCHPKSPITKEGVCDMLVKYHLFSWDI